MYARFFIFSMIFYICAETALLAEWNKQKAILYNVGVQDKKKTRQAFRF